MNRLTYCVLLIALATSVASCGGSADPVAAKNSVPSITVLRPQLKDAVRSITMPGDLVGFYESALHAKVTGYLKHIDVDKGDWVKTGQVLAVLEVPELTQNLERARANLTIERLTYERLKKVRDTDPRLVAQQEVDIVYAKWAQAKAEVGALETMVSYTRITAPFDGVITGRFVDPGALIRAGGEELQLEGSAAAVSPGATEGGGGHKEGGPVLTLAKIDKLRVYIYVPEQEAALVRRGMPATITLKEFPDRRITGVVSRFATALDLSTRTMLTEIDVDNPSNRLYPRMYATVSLELVRHSNAIQIPAAAVEQGGKTFVYVVRKDELVKVPVATGISDGRNIEITSGLTGHELVVSNISPALNNGEKVRPILINARQAEFGGREVASTD